MTGRYEEYLRMVLGMACSKAERQEILFNVATMPDKRGEPPLAWRRRLALAYGWQPIGGRRQTMLDPLRYGELVDFVLAESHRKANTQEAIDRGARRIAAAFPGLTQSELERATAEAKARLVAGLKQKFAKAKVDFPADLERLLAGTASPTQH